MEDYLKEFIFSRLNITYTETYAYSYSIRALFWGLKLTIVSLVGRFAIKSIQKKSRVSKEPLLSSNNHIFEENRQEIQYQELTKYLRKKSRSESIIIQLLLLLSSIGIVFAFLIYGVIPSILSSLGVIPIFLCVVLMALNSIITASLLLKLTCPSEVKQHIKLQLKYESNVTWKRLSLQASFMYRMYPFAAKSVALMLALYPILIPFVTSRSCMAYYTPSEYGSTFDAYSISTSFSRFFSISKACPSGQIGHTYATLAEDPSTSIILNVHTGSDIDNLYVLYGAEEDFSFEGFEENAANQTFKSYYLNIEWKGQRYIHSAYLDNLEPKTLYYAQFYYKGSLLGDAKFSTLPSKNMEENITIISGGDSGGTEKSAAFIHQLHNYNPDLIIIGGDIVYDNGNINCYACWDYFLDQFKVLNNNVGRLVPFILGVGNHDVGLNNHQFIKVDKYQNLFFLYFPQHILNKEDLKYEIPDPHQRRSYFAHTIGNMLHVTLDSGYLVKYSGIQASWLKNISIAHADRPKMATYHTPMISGCHFNPDKYGFDNRVKSWAPIFEKYKFMSVFENHMHVFKRTFPIRFSNETKGPGVVYFGDGAMGVHENDCFDRVLDKNVTGVFAQLGKINHIWIIKLSDKEINYSAINLKGETIDNYTQKIAKYKAKVN